MCFNVRFVAVCAIPLGLLFTASTHAQQPVAAAVTPSPMVCDKPSEFAPTFRSKDEVTRFQKRLDVYRECVLDYAKAQTAKANEIARQAQTYQAASDKALNDFNEYIGMLNKASEGGGGVVAPKINP